MKIYFFIFLFFFTLAFPCYSNTAPSFLNISIKNLQQNIDVEISNTSSDLLIDTLKTVPPNYFIEQFDNTKGLSNSSINTIFQDSENLVWIGTWDGLNRYDGNNFKIFRPELNNENSLSNQVVLKIVEDNTGLIWVLTMHGINSYNKRSNTFQRYYFSSKNEFTLSESEFNMAVDNSNSVFCAVKDWGLGYFNGSEFQKIGVHNLPLSAVKNMEFATSGELLLLFENNDLFSLKFQTKETGRKVVLKSEKISNNIRAFEIFPNQKIGIISLDGEVVIHSLSDQKVIKINSKKVQNIIGKTSEGLIFSNKNEYFTVNNSGIIKNQSWFKHLDKQVITTLIQGTENVVWAGTDGNGLLKMYPYRKSFNLISTAQVPELDGGIVRAFSEAKGNSFFVGTKGKGLFKFDSEFYLNPNKSLKYDIFNEGNSSINNAVFALCKGQDDLIFIGTDGEGISVFDLKKSKVINWSEILDSELYEYFKSTYAIYQDESGFIWLGTNGYGLIRLKIERIGGKLKVTYFKIYRAGSEENKALSSNIIFSIIPKNEDELWIATRLGGLNLFNIKSELFKVYKNDKNNPQSISNNDILCLYTDANDNLWIGTSFGLNLLKDKKNEDVFFKSFTVKEGLPNNTIHGIVSDKNNNLWISTNFGLSNFIVNNQKFINFTKQEGLQNNEYADGAYYKDNTTGYVFMGGIKGFNYFLPSKLEESKFIPNILIDKISGQNQAIPYDQGLVISPNSKTFDAIVLEHNQNFFDIELAALTYINSEKCQYAYKLDNFDQDWNLINNRKIISYTNVPHGNYSLWIKWSNSDGVWSNEIRAIDIKIKAVFWQSNIAIAIYLVLVIVLILFVVSYYQKRESLKRTILFRKRDEEIHQNQLTFFTNIAHELQTPLTLIVGPAQKLSESIPTDEKNYRFIKMIQRSSSRLLLLTQQLLDFRKAEYHHLEVTVKQFDLVDLMEQVVELFDEWALQKNIDYKVEMPTELIGWFDKDKIEKIVFNLLSNAFKYTPIEGTILFKISKDTTRSNAIKIEVINSGIGIPKDKLDSIFMRFFLAEKEEGLQNDLYRTGIGLAYTKKIVEVMKGEIGVESKKNKQTTFTVILPSDNDAFTSKEMDVEEKQVIISHHLQNMLVETPSESDKHLNKSSSLDSILNMKKTVLIVEDEREIQKLLIELLKEQYSILIASNGVEALEIIKKKIPDIIISDVMMPEMDGLEFCRRIRNKNETCHIPFIMLTAKNSVINRIEGIESGANSFISKPFYPDHLLIRVQKLIEEKEKLKSHFSKGSFIENVTSLPVDDNDKEFMRKVIEMIQANIESENLQSLYLEQELGMSSSHLYRKVKQLFGLAPGDLIRSIRLKHAAELLRKSSLTVSEVCYKCGFNNRSYFYREFKKMYHITPKVYQIKNTSN